MKAYRGEKKSSRELFAAEALKPEQEIDLGRASLLIAKSEYPELDVESYLQRLDQIAGEISNRLPAHSSTGQASVQKIIEQINEHLYRDLSFRGNEDSYYDPKNSFLNEVLDRRIGIPITLSVIYIEVARRLGIKVEGVGLPGHFLVKCQVDNEEILFDAFNGGRRLSESDCEQLVKNIYGDSTKFDRSLLRSVSK